MRNNSGKSGIGLLIITVIIIIIMVFGIKFVRKKLEENRLQDLRTNMLIIEAKSKKKLEEICVNTVNLDEEKEEDLLKINEVKETNLKGIKLKDSPQQVKDEISKIEGFVVDDNCYYLNPDLLDELGIKNIDEEKSGYFVVKYDFDNESVEVINTNGYEGIFTLTQIKEKCENE